MRINISAGMCFLVAAWGTLLCAQPLGAQTEAKVAESVKRWADEIDGAANPKALREAREGMTKAYAFYAGKGQGFAYAQEAWKALSGMLKDAGPAKQINLAMVLSKMPTTSAQPALDAMVAHPNTAVRYLGWRGYRDARTAILSLNDKSRKAFFASLKVRAGAESSPAVIQMLTETARLPRELAVRLGASVLKDAQGQALAAMEAGWTNWCQRVINQDDGMAEAGQDTVAALGELYVAMGSPPKMKKAVLQRIYDMMFCASQVYTKSTAESSDAAAGAAAALLIACEKMLRALSAIDTPRVQKALQQRTALERKLKVGIGVIKWREALKLQAPRYKPGEPATRPATRPATQPATQPTTKPAKVGPATTPAPTQPATKTPAAKGT